MKGRVLVIDNEPSLRRLVVKALGMNGLSCDEADGFESAQAKILTCEYDVLLTDKNMPVAGKDVEGGMELIRWVRQNRPKLAVLLMTGYPSIETAVEALKLGAFDYLIKPLDLKLLVQKVNRVCECMEFMNPEAVLDAYAHLNREIMEVSGNNPADIAVRLTQVQESLNQLFQIVRSAERSLLKHRQRLVEIVEYAERSQEDLSADNPAKQMLQHIVDEAALHV